MSEVISRPSASRGRGSGRGGRGGFAGRGGRRTNGDNNNTTTTTGSNKTDQSKAGLAADESLAGAEDEGEFAELRKLYGDKTSVIREMFPDWSDIDILYVLQETNGDQAEAVTRIAEGLASQWDEVSKPKKTTRPKAKEAPAPSTQESSATRPVRGGRNAHAPEAGRGRGRAGERGGRAGRGRSANPAAAIASVGSSRANKEHAPLSVPTEESSAWHDAAPHENGAGAGAGAKQAVETPAASASASATEHHASKPPPAVPAPVKTWASMLRQSTAPKKPAPPAPHKEAPAPRPAEPAPESKLEPESEAVSASVDPEHAPREASLEPEPKTEPAPHVEQQQHAEVGLDAEATPVPAHALLEPSPPAEEPVVELPPPQDDLTETNLEQVADESKPPATDTAASTAADSWDPRQSPVPAPVIPLSASQQQAQRAAAASGYAATALKATGDRHVRPPTFQRRVLDQEEAVRMPVNRDLDRAAVQFGAFNLSETDDDIDGDREEPETRAQPPADSPITHPRTSLPPSQPIAVPEVLPQKTATITAPPPGMGPAANLASSMTATAASAIPQPTQPLAPINQQYSRFGQAAPQDVQAAQPKPLDHFAQQATAVSQPPFDTYASQSSQAQVQQPGMAYSSAPGEYSAYYTANQQDRPYNFYGQHLAQQGAHGQPEPSQVRPFGGYNASHADNSLSQYPQSGVGLSQPRFGANSESQNSGHSTPNPAAQTQQQVQQPQQPQQQAAPGSQPQTHGQQQQQQQYPGYTHPYYSHPYYHQYYSGYGQGGFPYAKGGMYGQPYGVTPNAPYDHTSSPGAFGPSSLHRDSPLGSGLGDYGRAATGQANTQQPGLGASGFGGAHDSFSRGAHAYQSQGQVFANQSQPGAGASADELKPFGDAKSGSGPSPSLGGPRPGSATNTVPGSQSGSLPPPQSSQVGSSYGMYPSHHLQGHGLHGSNAYGMGGGAGSQHQSTPHGSYGQQAGFGSGYYGGGGHQQQQGGQQGQQQQQQQQQQRGGWGGNYH